MTCSKAIVTVNSNSNMSVGLNLCKRQKDSIDRSKILRMSKKRLCSFYSKYVGFEFSTEPKFKHLCIYTKMQL